MHGVISYRRNRKVTYPPTDIQFEDKCLCLKPLQLSVLFITAKHNLADTSTIDLLSVLGGWQCDLVSQVGRAVQWLENQTGGWFVLVTLD